MTVTNRMIGILLGFALAVLGVGVVLEAALRLGGLDWTFLPWEAWAGALQEATWRDLAVVSTLVLMVAVGLLVLLLELRPSKPSELWLTDARPDRHASVDRRGLEERLAALVDERVDTVSTRVSTRRRSVRVAVVVPADADVDAVRGRASEVVADALRRLELVEEPALRVTAERRRERVS